MTVVGDLIGVAPSDREQFRTWSDTVVHQDVDRPETVEAGRAAAAPSSATSARSSPRAGPSPPTTWSPRSSMRPSTANGSRDEEILGFCFLLIVAGTETTTNLLGLGVLALADAPDQRALLLGDPALIGGAVEEMLRWGSPVQGLARTTTEPVRRHGVEIPAGAKVQLLFGAANRDEREFADPDRFDVRRPNRAAPRVRARRPLLPRRGARPPRGHASCSRSCLRGSRLGGRRVGRALDPLVVRTGPGVAPRRARAALIERPRA